MSPIHCPTRIKLLLALAAAAIVGGCGEKTTPPSAVPEVTNQTPEQQLAAKIRK